MLKVLVEDHVADDGVVAGHLGGGAVQADHGQGVPVGVGILVVAGVQHGVGIPHRADDHAALAGGHLLHRRAVVVDGELSVDQAVGVHLADHFQSGLGLVGKGAEDDLTLFVGVVHPEVLLGIGAEDVEQAVHLEIGIPQILAEGQADGVVHAVAVGVLMHERVDDLVQIVPVLRILQTQLLHPVGAQPEHGNLLAGRGVQNRDGHHLAVVGRGRNGRVAADALDDGAHVLARVRHVDVVQVVADQAGVGQHLQLRGVDAQQIRDVAGGDQGVDLVVGVGRREGQLELDAQLLFIGAAPDVVLVAVTLGEGLGKVYRDADGHGDGLRIGLEISPAAGGKIAQVACQLRLRSQGRAAQGNQQCKRQKQNSFHRFHPPIQLMCTINH